MVRLVSLQPWPRTAIAMDIELIFTVGSVFIRSSMIHIVLVRAIIVFSPRTSEGDHVVKISIVLLLSLTPL